MPVCRGSNRAQRPKANWPECQSFRVVGLGLKFTSASKAVLPASLSILWLAPGSVTGLTLEVGCHRTQIRGDPGGH